MINRKDTFMMSKMKCFGLFAGCALATGALYATTPTYSESFEIGSTWTGGVLTPTSYTYSVTGSALPMPSATHAQVLVIEGNASYTNATGTTLSASPVVDMMVQTARPDDELGFPSSENTGDIQIAVAVDSNGCFNAYCKNKSNTVGWYKLSTHQYTATEWARVSFLFDYSNNRCQIRIDGQPAVSEYGYLKADTDDAGNGAWYKLAKDTTAASYVNSMKVIGCTAIDDVVMNVGSGYTYPLDTVNTTDVAGVPYSWYDDYGIAWTPNATAPDASGMTVAQKHDACLSPFDDQVFEVKSMAVAEANGTATVTVGIPEFVATPGRKVVIDYGTDKSFTSCTTEDVATGQSTVAITVPAGAVVYYRLRATTAQ